MPVSHTVKPLYLRAMGVNQGRVWT